jgi:methionyl-tRNA formyltransferase
MQIILMGTGPFAVPMARAIYASSHIVPLVVTRPLRKLHGKSQAQAQPMRQLAIERGTPVFDPESINTDEARAELARHNPDLLVVCDYGQILKPATLAIARLGGINLHGSLLPKYRGAAPINWAVYHGESQTGVTAIHMTPQLDAGPIIAQAAMPIGAQETAETLEPQLAELGVPLVMQVIAQLEVGTAQPLPQDAAQTCLAPRLKKEDGKLDWNRPAAALVNQIRAFVPWPKSFTFWLRKQGEPIRLIIDRAQIVEKSATAGVPGTILVAQEDRLWVATGDGILQVDAVQPAGKRILTAAEFLRGYPVVPGEELGNLPS